jgi:hypothetical protein
MGKPKDLQKKPIRNLSENPYLRIRGKSIQWKPESLKKISVPV